MTLPATFELTDLPREGESLSKHKLAKPDYRIDEDTGCWEWLKFKLKGYGRRPAGGLSQYAHRAYYEAAYGPIPDKHDVHHKCENPGCVNPAHLEAVPWRQHDEEHWLAGKGLSIETIKEIRELGRQPGVRACDVAERFGISEFSVYRHWRGDSWAESLGEPELIKPVLDCPQCGETFTPKHRTAVYCSPRCRSTFNNDKKRRAA